MFDSTLANAVQVSSTSSLVNHRPSATHATGTARNGQRTADSDLMVTLSAESKAMEKGGEMYQVDVSYAGGGGGLKNIDLDSYFSPSEAPVSLLSQPLLLPNARNLNALQQHISSVMPSFLAEHNIASAPETVRFDGEGKVQLPEDYPYADEFQQALTEDPGMARRLRTANALGSHMVEIQRATTQGTDYSRQYAQMALAFSESGLLTVLADNKPALSR